MNQSIPTEELFLFTFRTVGNLNLLYYNINVFAAIFTDLF